MFTCTPPAQSIGVEKSPYYLQFAVAAAPDQFGFWPNFSSRINQQ